MLVFILSLLLICVVAGVVVTAFAYPQLRAGSRVLTPKGERVVGRFGGPLRPLADAVWPRVRPVVRPVARLLILPARAVRRRLEPALEPVIRAVEEGSGSRPPASAPDVAVDPPAPPVAAEDRLELMVQPFRPATGRRRTRHSSLSHR